VVVAAFFQCCLRVVRSCRVFTTSLRLEDGQLGTSESLLLRRNELFAELLPPRQRELRACGGSTLHSPSFSNGCKHKLPMSFQIEIATTFNATYQARMLHALGHFRAGRAA
jgi:hypothetical protein